MTQTIFNHPKDLTCYATLQGVNAYKTVKTSSSGEPLATDAFLVPDFVIEADAVQIMHKDQIGKMLKDGATKGMRAPKWSMPATSVRPSGTAGTEPDLKFLFQTGIWDATVYGLGTATTTIAGSTTRVLNVTTAANMTAYQDVITVADTDGSIEFALITAITSNVVTITPPLSFTPASGAAIGKTNTYRTADTCEEPAFDCTAIDTWEAAKVSGAVAQNTKFSWGANNPPTVEASGFGRSAYQVGSTTPSGNYEASATTIAVVDHKMFDVETGGSICLTIEADGGNSAENLRVTGRNSSTGVLTIETFAGGNPTTDHGSNAVIRPYRPTPSYTGDEIPPKSVQVRVGTATATSEVLLSESGSITFANGVQPRTRGHGDTWEVDGFYLSSDLDISASFTMFSKKNTASWRQRALDREELPTCCQMGDEAGKSMAVIVPRMMFQTFKPGARGDGAFTGELTAKAVGAVGEQDAVTDCAYIAFG